MMDDLIRGEFIDLRSLHEDDAELTFAWRQTYRARFLNEGAQTDEEQLAWIHSRTDNELNFIIQIKNGQPIGMISLVAIDTVNRRAESARFLIGDENAAKGIPAAVEAMMLLYDIAFERMGLVRVYGTVASGNSLMIKWQRYLGMKEEGRLRNHYFVNNTWQDAVCLGLLEEEYRKEGLPRMKRLIANCRSL